MNIGKIGPSILLAYHAQSLKWPIAMGELCDNSFDADASRVELRFGVNRQLEVIDDGKGCGDIERMLTLGEHLKQSTTALGRWGVGLKETACWLWGELHITTNFRSTIRTAWVNWDSLSRNATWDVPDPIEKKSVVDDPLGTRLVFRNIGKDRKFPDFLLLRDELSYWFTPALRSGRQIVIRTPKHETLTCSAWTPPPVTDIVRADFDVNGKGVKLVVGIVPPEYANPRSGFSFCHRHRVIFNSHLGANGHSVARLCGVIELDEKWTLGKNKTEIVDDTEWLEDAIYKCCEAIILKAEEQAQIIRNDALESAVSNALQSILRGDQKEKRDPGNTHGTVKRKQTGKTRKRASKTQIGNKIKSANSFRMEWRPRTDGLIGDVDVAGKSCVVYLNDQHARLAVHKLQNNADALVDNCLFLVAAQERERFLPGVFQDQGGVVENLSILLARQEGIAATGAINTRRKIALVK